MNTTLRIVTAFIFSLLLVSSAFAEGDNITCVDPQDYDPGKDMMHHVLDAHDWHLLDWPVESPAGTAEGMKCYKSIGIHLPWILYSTQHGLEFFGSTHSLEASGRYEVDEEHGAVHHVGAGHHDHAEEGHDHDHAAHDHGPAVYDFSMTKTVVQMLLVLIIATLIFTSVARGFKKNEGKAPKGIQSFFEPIITFVRDDVANNYLGAKAAKYTPYLLSLFFFIWFSNLLGITPLNSNIMGNISVTFVLAFITFVLVQINGTKHYWGHIIAMPGVPKWMLPLVTLIEIFGLFIKPVALMIRLFANITAGHFMILALVSLIFILGKGGTSLAGSFGIMPLSVLFTIGIFCLEVIVGIIQAYVFTLLTAVFMGQAMETHDHGDDHAHAH
ncbi:MAG: F0F1 ATP synthase subunit A [Bacteroidia bacterium]